MPVLSREVTLTHGCVATVAEQCELALPATLAREPVSYDAAESVRRRESAYGELAQLGLMEHAGPSQALLDSLSVLCRAAIEFFGYVETTSRRYSLHAASYGQDALFATMADGNVRLRPSRPESILNELLAELPEANPGNGPSLSASAAELRPLGARARATGAAPRGDTRRIIELFDQPRLAGGQLQAGARTGLDNRRSKSPDPIGFVDTEQGRWLTYATTGADGSTHVTAAPGRTDTIAAKLHEAQQALHTARH